MVQGFLSKGMDEFICVAVIIWEGKNTSHRILGFLKLFKEAFSTTAPHSITKKGGWMSAL